MNMTTLSILNNIQLRVADYLFAEGSFVGFLAIVLFIGFILFVASKLILSLFQSNKSSE